jgi:hypothetical protein
VVDVVFQEEVVVLVKIDPHMKVVVVAVVNNVHNVLINTTDHKTQMKLVVLNKVVKPGQMKPEMIINHLVDIVAGVAVDHDVEIMKEAEAVVKEAEVVVKAAEEVKEAEVVAEAVVVVDVVIMVTEILKKVHSNNNNHKKTAIGNKIPSMYN